MDASLNQTVKPPAALIDKVGDADVIPGAQIELFMYSVAGPWLLLSVASYGVYSAFYSKLLN